jgi:hypothetical protein
VDVQTGTLGYNSTPSARHLPPLACVQLHPLEDGETGERLGGNVGFSPTSKIDFGGAQHIGGGSPHPSNKSFGLS